LAKEKRDGEIKLEESKSLLKLLQKQFFDRVQASEDKFEEIKREKEVLVQSINSAVKESGQMRACLMEQEQQIIQLNSDRNQVRN